MEDLIFKGNDDCRLYGKLLESCRTVASEAPQVVMLLHGGGPDHQSLIPLARQLSDHQVILPDVRGYGRSVCKNESSHTWSQYAADVVALLDQMGVQSAVVGGAGLGSTISLRTAIAYPERVKALFLISVEDIEDDEAKQKEVEFMDAFAARVRGEGLEAAWAPILKDLAPIIETMVRDAIPRTNSESIAAAAAIGRDRSFRSIEELSKIKCPTLIFPGMDWRHPKALAEKMAQLIEKGELAKVSVSSELRTTEDFAKTFAPRIRQFLKTLA